MKKIILVAILFSGIAKSNVDLIQATTNKNTVFKTTFSYLIESQKFEEAKKYTKRKRAEEPNNPELVQYDGLASYLMSDYQDAIIAFKKASSMTSGPYRATNLYLMAQANLKLGNSTEVLENLNSMEEISEARSYVTSARKELATTGRLPEYVPQYLVNPANMSSTTSASEASGPGSAGAIINFKAVYGIDSNPVFIPDFSQEKNEAESSFTSYTLNLNHQLNSKIGKIGNTLSFGYTKYGEEIAQSFNNGRLSLLSSWDPKIKFFEKNQITFSNKLDRSYQAEDRFEYYFTSDVFSLRKEIFQTGIHELSGMTNFGFRTYANKNLVNKEDDRSGASYALKLIYKISNDDWAILNSFGATDQQTYGKKFNTLAYDYALNLQKILFWDIEFMSGFSATQINYVNSEDDRVDLMTSYGADLGRDVSYVKGLSAKFSYSHTKNNSDLDASTYSQDIFSFWINYDY